MTMLTRKQIEFTIHQLDKMDELQAAILKSWLGE